MNSPTLAMYPPLDRSMRVRVIEEVLINADDDQPDLAWHARRQRDGGRSVVGLLTTAGATSIDHGPADMLSAKPLCLMGLIDREPLLDPLLGPRLLGMCDGGGMVFEECRDNALPRRWTILPMDATGQLGL